MNIKKATLTLLMLIAVLAVGCTNTVPTQKHNVVTATASTPEPAESEDNGPWYEPPGEGVVDNGPWHEPYGDGCQYYSSRIAPSAIVYVDAPCPGDED